MNEKTNGSPEATPPGYEPPAVKEVLSADDLERESHYAGATGSLPPIG